MNVLVLTPDAVGSTLLQRMITIYMQFHQFDKPVINIHEVTNGIKKFYSPDFNIEMLGRHPEPTYHQSLGEITQLLTEADHYKVARLAAYHVDARRDTIEQQVPFFRYLNDNYFVICTKRRNLFEHGLSWAINRVTKKLNVYTKEEKLNSFSDLYRSGITVDVEVLENIWNQYIKYLSWAEQNFSVGSYYYYEDHVDQIEKYILNLPVFAGQQNLIGWKDTFGIDFKDWNRCHYLNSNVGRLLSNSTAVQQQISYSTQQTQSAVIVKEDSFELAVAKDFVDQNREKYQQVSDSIEHMTKLGILTTPVPIKKQTMAEKMHIVKNFDECLDFYNTWILDHPAVSKPVSKEELLDKSYAELKKWFSPDTGTSLVTVDPK